ncbi:pyridoxamine kinase [uncultured Murdochiella sp.]|uniref:pyridoxamine kinase n=1 Tax=uncultured Murdochiella sp. TaxID=1586095 RepID=UPI0028064366|nr:pyridoxamine kinase [uncultured Murdochiella sp.]
MKYKRRAERDSMQENIKKETVQNAKNHTPRILTMQDISCVGQCSLTVALPILSACGIETAVLPSAVLSTHTGFSSFTFRDLTDDIAPIMDNWQKQGLVFEALYTGYLGNMRQVELVKSLQKKVLTATAKTFIDPAMADNGKLYVGFDQRFVDAMKSLIAVSDVLLPNITEACLLTDTPYREEGDIAWMHDLAEKLLLQGAKNVVLTGINQEEGKTGVLVAGEAGEEVYTHRMLHPGSHGTGDIFASVLVGACMRGKSLEEAARIAADFTVLAVEETHKDTAHWYGARFEPVLEKLMRLLTV